MTVFIVQDKNPLKYGVLIDSFQDGARLPAILVSGAENGFPGDTRALAVNFANLLNGAPAQEDPAMQGRVLHYCHHDHGVTLYHRDPAAGGVSVAGLHFTLVDRLQGAERKEVLGKLGPHFMKQLCATAEYAQKPEAGHHVPTSHKRPEI